MSEDDQPTGELRWRTAVQVGLDYQQRTIELIVMPYDTETRVQHQGRMITESIAPGAFKGIQRRSNRIRVNRDHDVTRTVGRALAFHPDRPEGLIGEIRVARTQLGDETLALADEGCLDASAGFLPMPGGEVWEDRDRVRVTKAWLGHIALVPDPAYETARVLAVRQADEPPPLVVVGTPNLDLVRSWKRQEELARLSL